MEEIIDFNASRQNGCVVDISSANKIVVIETQLDKIYVGKIFVDETYVKETFVNEMSTHNETDQMSVNVDV